MEVKVKPLVWEPSFKPWHSAKAPWGYYYVQWDDETQAWFASLEMGEIEGPIILDPFDVPTMADAQAAAQAHHDEQIRSAIIQPTLADALALPEIKALVDALEFYADNEAWRQPPVKTYEGLFSIEYENQASKIRHDRGSKARAALAALPTEE